MAAPVFNIPIVKVRKQRVFRGGNNLTNLTEREMRERYRFGRETFDFLVDLLGKDLQRGTMKKTALTVEEQLSIALRYYASGSFLQVIGDTLGYDKSTVSRAVDDVTNAILARKNDFISFPTSKADIDEVKLGFHEQANFPHVVGCIDGTHVRIQRPTEDEPAYVNRKNFSSINVQAVCNHEGKFTQITADWPGSVHDSHIFKTSSICKHLEENHKGLVDGVLLGDSGYMCRPFLLTPYNNPQEPHQERFNGSHVSTRSLIERTFGVWKRRFHVLHSEIRMKPDKVCRIIGACAVLHNIAVLRKEPLDETPCNNPPPVPVNAYNGPQDGKSVRDYIARSFF
ncbi:putative nuclease HARBI1 [Mytilus edulis]|uniref:putative nuclease HARBI1 n=1 Tax=Mytilus edulis TaxID=6550 RepID=UPI0039F11B76